MAFARWLSVGLIALAVGACGSSTTPVAVASPSPFASPSATCVPSAGRSLALVTLRGSDQVVVRDVTDIAHQTSIGTVSSAQIAVGAIEPAVAFACSSLLAYLGLDTSGLPTSVYTTPLAGSPSSAVISGNLPILAFAWRADGGALAYITRVDESALHILQDGRDRAVGPAPLPGLVGGCESAPCPPALQNQNPPDNWDVRLAYSPDGAYISLVQTSLNSNLRIWTSDGGLVTSLDQQATTMSVWSGTSLYFRDAHGVAVWRDGSITSFLPGVAWIRPKASPDGSHLVYSARDANGAAHVFVVDTNSRQTRDLGSARAEPAFLTSRYVWYQAEPACTATGACSAHRPGTATATGKTYVYDLVDGTETESAITAVLDVWPRA